MRPRTPATSQELIGQFGVGFYAAFMVADRVELITRRAGEDGGTRWESDGAGTYTVTPIEDAPQGTAVTLHLKPADAEDNLHDYTAEWTIREIVKRYSDFIAQPIRMAVERPGSDGAEATTETVTLNSMKALWARPRGEVEPAEYHEFYKHVSHDWSDPLETIHMRGEGTFEYEALLFIPSHAPLDLFSPQGRRGVQLYVKRVFIMDDCDALMPNYLRFVKGVVDAHDLSLNISREILQQDRQIRAVRRRLVKKVLATVKELKTAQPERYRTFWTEFGAAVKEGLIDDTDNQDVLLEILSVASTHDEAELTDLAGYVGRMKDGQSDIYYATGENRATIENSPHMEAFRAKGYEVLLLTDPVDEVWVERVGSYDGRTAALGGQGPGRPGHRGGAQGGRGRAGAAARRVRRPARLDGRGARRLRQGGTPVVAADHVAGLRGRRRPGHHPDAGEDVPGDGSRGAEGQADPGAEPDPSARHRPAQGARAGRAPTVPWRRPPSCCTAWRCSPRAATWPTRPGSPGSSPTASPAPSEG